MSWEYADCHLLLSDCLLSLIESGHDWSGWAEHYLRH